MAKKAEVGNQTPDEIKQIRDSFFLADDESLEDAIAFNRILDCRDEQALLDFLSLSENKIISQFSKEYLETKSPMVLWTVVYYCFLSAYERHSYLEPFERAYDFYRERNDLPGLEPYTNDQSNIEKNQWFLETLEKCPPTLMPPKWVQKYLRKCYLEMSELCYNERLSPQRSVQKLPEVFGFVRPGWNAIAEDRKGSRDYELYQRFVELTRESGLSKSAAKKTILQESKLKDERSLQRIIAKTSKSQSKLLDDQT